MNDIERFLRRAVPGDLLVACVLVRAGVRELFDARELTLNLVRRDLKVRHRGTFLGMLWSLTTPLLLVGLYYCIFRFVFRANLVPDLPRPDGRTVPFAVYFFAGLTIWNFFSASVAASTTCITGSGYLLNKVWFPRAILPISTVLSALVTFAFELGVLLAVSFLLVGPPSPHILWAPFIVAIIAVLALGLALLLSALTVLLHDIAHFVGIFMQLWFWGTPIIYSLMLFADRPHVGNILKFNPVTGTVVSFRNVVVLNRPPRFELLAYDLAFGLVMLVVGWVVFTRFQRLFSEIV